MALQSRMQLARPRGVRLGCRVLGCRVGSMGLGATKGARGCTYLVTGGSLFDSAVPHFRVLNPICVLNSS